MLKKIISGALVLATLVCMAPAVIAEDEAAALTLTDSSHLTLDRDSGYIDGIDGIPTVAELAANFVGSVTVSGADGNAKNADDAVATDDVVSCGDDSLKALIYGDVNGDGKINMTDALAILKYAAKWGNALSELAADVDKDGKTTISDAVKLLKAIAGWDGISLGNVRMIAENKKLTAPAEDSSIDLFFTSSMNKIARVETESTGNYVFKMKAARNEYESCQVILVSDKDVEGLTAEITDFEYEYGGATLEASLNWEHYYKIYIADKVSGMKYSDLNDQLHAGLGESYYPEALPNMAETFELKANSSQGIMITANVGKDAPAGMYRATFSVKNADGEVIKTAYVYTYVWDFTLPDAPYSASAFNIMRYALYSNTREYDNYDLYAEFYDFMLEYNLSAYNLPYDITDPAAEEYMNDPRVTSFVISGMDEAYGAEMAHDDEYIVEAYAKVMSNPEWAKKGYFYYTDEPYGEGLQNVKTRWEYVRDLLGTEDFRNMTPLASNTSYASTEAQANGIDAVAYIEPYINVWCPQSGAFLDKADGGVWSPTRSVKTYGDFSVRAKKFKEEGDEMWWYVCCAPEYPYANLFLWYQGVIIRDLMWQQYMNDVDGLLYYAVTVGWEHLSARRDAIDGNGDGLLMYYGQLYGQRGPVASIRLLQTRDAFDDFDYLSIAEEYYGRDEVMKVVNKVTTNMLQFTEDEDVLEACREELAEMIVAAQAKEK